MSLEKYAEQELDILGLGKNDPTGDSMDYHMREHIMMMVRMFSAEGHSGFSANYALSILKRVLAFKPLTPLTGEDSEWNYVYDDDSGFPVYQNKRASSVFKDQNGAYWSDGRVFWEWHSSKDIVDGKPYKSYYTSRDSAVPIASFPWTMPDAPEYVEVEELHE
jgi:hypothetical protein